MLGQVRSGFVREWNCKSG